jgi:hypothetical protein
MERMGDVVMPHYMRPLRSFARHRANKNWIRIFQNKTQRQQMLDSEHLWHKPNKINAVTLFSRLFYF